MASQSRTHFTYLEYHGAPGVTELCSDAVERLLHSRRTIREAIILTLTRNGSASHALLLIDDDECEIIIKAGFGSGYGGSGPSGFSKTLGLLNWHNVSLEEVLVDTEIMNRLEASALTIADLKKIKTSRKVRPKRLWDYIYEDDYMAFISNPWRRREPIVPFAILDERLATVVRDFWADPDSVLLKAHRQLEEAIRTKSSISRDEAQGGPAKVYSAAFNQPPRLTWPGVTASEHVGRANLFHGVLAAYRNPRAHRNMKEDPDEQLRELLLLNHLFRLEAEAVAT